MLCANLGGFCVESRDHAETLLMEPSISQQGTAQVAHAHQGHLPLAVGSQNVANCGHQFLAAISDARMAKVPKMGQILADLGVGESQPLA